MFCQRLTQTAKLPTKAHPTDAGYDLSSDEDTVIPPLSGKLISTGIKITNFPLCTYGRIAPRSGLTVKNNINVGAGVIDSSYTGEVKVFLFNHSKENTFPVTVGQRIAQLIITYISNEYEFIDVSKESFDEYVNFFNKETQQRGENGFGSTDLHTLPLPSSEVIYSTTDYSTITDLQRSEEEITTTILQSKFVP